MSLVKFLSTPFYITQTHSKQPYLRVDYKINLFEENCNNCQSNTFYYKISLL